MSLFNSMSDDMSEAKPKKWSGRSHGGSFGHRLVHFVARIGGPTICYLFIIPPTIVLFLRLHERRRICMRYWQRMRPRLGRWGQAVMAFRHFYSFARMLADRFLISAAPGSLRHRSLGFTTLKQGSAHPQGCVMLSAHVGNWELSGHFMDRYQLGTTHLVMLQAEDPAVAAQVRAAIGAHGLGIIDLKDSFAASLEIVAALRKGESCCMLGDRTVGSDQGTIRVPFCGGYARFPSGPFIASAATGAVVVPTFCLKVGWTSYATFAPAIWPMNLGGRRERKPQLTAAIARWARCVETVVRRYPLQWHNFYDFWEDGEDREAVAPRSDRRSLPRSGAPHVEPRRQ
jgi:predicted LPLAT superfamily acyltransferase